MHVPFSARLPPEEAFSRDSARARLALARPGELDGGEADLSEKIDSWTRGRVPALTRAIEELGIGDVTEPVEMTGEVVVARRLDPASVPDPEPPALRLPRPPAPDLDTFARGLSGPALGAYVRELAKTVPEVLPPGDGHDAVEGAFLRLARRFESVASADGRVAELHATLTELRSRLDPASYAALMARVNARVESDALGR